MKAVAPIAVETLKGVAGRQEKPILKVVAPIAVETLKGEASSGERTISKGLKGLKKLDHLGSIRLDDLECCT
jgi:hypothetical protein